MTDSTNEKRPVRKLTVKNFSVIKEAELEFGKITVLIGPQASGKSLLCKIAHFTGREIFDIATDHLVRGIDWVSFEAALQASFSQWFPQGGWGDKEYHIEFRVRHFCVRFAAPPEAVRSDARPQIDFDTAFRDSYNSVLTKINSESKRLGIFPPGDVLRSIAATELFDTAGRGIWDFSAFIPLERSYFVDTQRGYRLLGQDVDRLSSQFAVVYSDSVGRDLPSERVPRFLKGRLVRLPDGLWVAFDDGRLLPVGYLSGGNKQLLPILSVLDMYERQRPQSGGSFKAEQLYGRKLYSFDDFTVEEPEESLFPQTQSELVREFAALVNKPSIESHFTITTHSPYILSAFNNLIEAGQAARSNPALHDDVAKIIPAQYWIKDGDFKAYAIEDGQLKSILNESGFVEGNYLDQVSETIGDEFDRLIKLEYDHAKAS